MARLSLEGLYTEKGNSILTRVVSRNVTRIIREKGRRGEDEEESSKRCRKERGLATAPVSVSERHAPTPN